MFKYGYNGTRVIQKNRADEAWGSAEPLEIRSNQKAWYRESHMGYVGALLIGSCT
jgi:hypothetical protein